MPASIASKYACAMPTAPVYALRSMPVNGSNTVHSRELKALLRHHMTDANPNGALSDCGGGRLVAPTKRPSLMRMKPPEGCVRLAITVSAQRAA